MKRSFSFLIACMCVLATMALPADGDVVKKYHTLKKAEVMDLENTYSKMMTDVSTNFKKMENPSASPFHKARAASTSGFSKLGTGTLADNFFGGTTSVEIWKKSDDNTYYRILDPYKGITTGKGSGYEGAEYLDLIVMQQGATLGGISITKKDLVFFSDCNTGMYNSNYGDYVWAYHPFRFTNFQAESYWTYNKVLSYQSDGITPKQVQLAPMYYIENQGGWDQTQVDSRVIITFPSGSTTTSYPIPYVVSASCQNSNPAALTSNDELKLKVTYGNNGVSGNVTTVPVILTRDEVPEIIIAGSEVSNYFAASQNTTVSYTLSLSDVPTGNYYATALYYDETNASWFYSSNGIVEITVVPAKILVSRITLNETSASLNVGEKLQLSATILPANATDKTVSWSSNSPVATVSNAGLVNAVSAGNATITCTANDGSGVTATCSITVSSVPGPTSYPELNFVSVSCKNSNPGQLKTTDALNLSATFKNVGESGNVQTVPVIMTKDDNLDLVKVGDIRSDYFAASQNTTVNYSLPLSDVQPGSYYATVLFYQDSDDEEENGWYYSSKYLVDITVVNGGGGGDMVNNDNVIYPNNAEGLTGTQAVISFSMKNTASIRGFQFELVLPDGVTAAKDSKGRIMAKLTDGRRDPYDEHTLAVTEQADGSLLFLCGSLYNETFQGNDGEVATLTVDIDENMTEGDYPIILRNIKLTESDISKYYETSEMRGVISVKSIMLGDINNDGLVDVSDYIGVANRILGNTPAGFVEKAGDVDQNGIIDVSDYIGVANIILTGSIYGKNNRSLIHVPSLEDIKSME